MISIRVKLFLIDVTDVNFRGAVPGNWSHSFSPLGFTENEKWWRISYPHLKRINYFVIILVVLPHSAEPSLPLLLVTALAFTSFGGLLGSRWLTTSHTYKYQLFSNLGTLI